MGYLKSHPDPEVTGGMSLDTLVVQLVLKSNWQVEIVFNNTGSALFEKDDDGIVHCVAAEPRSGDDSYAVGTVAELVRQELDPATVRRAVAEDPHVRVEVCFGGVRSGFFTLREVDDLPEGWDEPLSPRTWTAEELSSDW